MAICILIIFNLNKKYVLERERVREYKLNLEDYIVILIQILLINILMLELIKLFYNNTKYNSMN